MTRRASSYLGLAACAFAGGLTGNVLLARLTPAAVAQSDGPMPPAALDGAAKAEYLSERFEAVARKLGPAVVAVAANKPSGSGTNSGKPVEESGSGVLIPAPDKLGTIVITNNHVVAGTRPDQITVSLADNRVVRPSQVLADAETDIALLRLDLDGLPTATFGDSDRCRIGQWVIAIGSPFGLNQSVSHGIISARERGQVSLGASIRIKDFFQTDAAINPGSSGGPLANLDGEVIGINTAIASQNGSNSGVAFSIPANLVQRISKQLLERGAVSRGYLGLQLAAAMEPAEALQLGLGRVRGAKVDLVIPESPAAQAGLQPRDVILTLDGVDIRTENHLINIISNLAAGRKVRLQVWRERQQLSVEATVADWTLAKQR